MKKQVLFFQGGGEDGYTADAKMVDSLRTALGSEYELSYPRLASDEGAPDFGWPAQMGKAIQAIKTDLVVVAHSVGASLLLKYLSGNSIPKNIKAIFLLATPFWRGKEDWKKGLILKKDFADQLSGDIPLFLYHCKDDEEVEFGDLGIYAGKLPNATVREREKGGHLFGEELGFLAEEIKNCLSSPGIAEK